MQYGMGTSESRASAQPTFFDRVNYIPGMKVDGMDVFAVKQATLFATDHAVNKVSSLFITESEYECSQLSYLCTHVVCIECRLVSNTGVLQPHTNQ